MRERYCTELESWIFKGWLKWWDGPVTGVIPLLAVFQPTKDKVRPVMDYCELNDFVECHTGDDMVAVCGEKVRKWRSVAGYCFEQGFQQMPAYVKGDASC